MEANPWIGGSWIERIALWEQLELVPCCSVGRLPVHPIPVLYEIPSRWIDRIREHILTTTGEDRSALRAHDFRTNRSVRLDFPDGSLALFRHAFYLRGDFGREVAVFMEHCGYYFFPAGELRVETLEAVWEQDRMGTDGSPSTPAA